ncbi:hypothetical protein ANN_14417 [Periplaneta americana]|uniref:PiggyBac transposable element-derived protein domain-containing protein n=1 Tax=Periplaneta americana TaxID=6978 RepID=A0ABQ8SXR1_PERAM|nr:hypothetical protein ANN_14417 [Periplaneta americana]
MSRKTTEELLEESTDSETEIENDDDDGEVVSEPEDQCIMRDKVDGDEVESSSEDDPDNLSEIEISDKYVTSTGRVYVSKPPRISRRAAQNIVKEREGLRSEGKVATIIESFEKFFTPEIVDSIIKYSNEEAIRQKVPGTSRLEFLAYIGLLIFMGKESDSKTAVTDLWSNISGRFMSFKVFMKDKPGKYDILIRMLTDSKSRYVMSMEPYAGKNKNAAQQTNSATAVVKRLVHPINNSGRNVTTDRYYTSVDLAEDLWNNHKLTLVGTLQANRKHIPQELKEVSGRELYSSKFAFSDPDTGSVPITIVSYIPREKPKRNLLMLSTQHYDDAIGAPSDPKKKTVINLYYNDTKGAALNGYTTFILNFPDWNKKKPNQRRLYPQELGLKLITPYIEARARNVTGLQKCVISAMEGILKRKIKQTSGAKKFMVPRTPCKDAFCVPFKFVIPILFFQFNSTSVTGIATAAVMEVATAAVTEVPTAAMMEAAAVAVTEVPTAAMIEATTAAVTEVATAAVTEVATAAMTEATITTIAVVITTGIEVAISVVLHGLCVRFQFVEYGEVQYSLCRRRSVVFVPPCYKNIRCFHSHVFKF